MAKYDPITDKQWTYIAGLMGPHGWAMSDPTDDMAKVIESLPAADTIGEAVSQLNRGQASDLIQLLGGVSRGCSEKQANYIMSLIRKVHGTVNPNESMVKTYGFNRQAYNDGASLRELVYKCGKSQASAIIQTLLESVEAA